MSRITQHSAALFCALVFVLITVQALTNSAAAFSFGGKKLDFFSNQQSSVSSTDTLVFRLAASVNQLQETTTIPDPFRLYDLDVDGKITEWEAKEVLKDFKENDSPFTEQEVLAFIDYFFNAH